MAGTRLRSRQWWWRRRGRPWLITGRRSQLSMIEVEIAGAVVRVTRQSDLDLMTAVARALKAAA